MMLADKAPPGVSDAFNYLIGQGVLGVICVLLIVGIVFLYRDWKAAHEKLAKATEQHKVDRAEDQKRMVEALSKVTVSSSELAKESTRSNDMVKASLDTQALAFDRQDRTFSEQIRTMDGMKRSLDDLEREQVHLLATIKANGKD
jgi:regulatory protein YycI of two-component signal transduction system YycFG